MPRYTSKSEFKSFINSQIYGKRKKIWIRGLPILEMFQYRVYLSAFSGEVETDGFYDKVIVLENNEDFVFNHLVIPEWDSFRKLLIEKYNSYLLKTVINS